MSTIPERAGGRTGGTSLLGELIARGCLLGELIAPGWFDFFIKQVSSPSTFYDAKREEKGGEKVRELHPHESRSCLLR
jgi:hypothetical protein